VKGKKEQKIWQEEDWLMIPYINTNATYMRHNTKR
jgi:hypothetical protein